MQNIDGAKLMEVLYSLPPADICSLNHLCVTDFELLFKFCRLSGFCRVLGRF